MLEKLIGCSKDINHSPPPSRANVVGITDKLGERRLLVGSFKLGNSISDSIQLWAANPGSMPSSRSFSFSHLKPLGQCGHSCKALHRCYACHTP
jgi:hypothetical protein